MRQHLILKPSERDQRIPPLAEMLKEAGLPDGGFNVVTETKVAVRDLAHPTLQA